MTLSAGTHLGPYEIQAPLGAGGMGEVYRARDTRLGREVAVKVLPKELSQDVERLSRFEQEARAASALNHPNIVTVHDIGRADGVFYVAMELVEGKTLRELSAAGALPVRKILSIAPQIADGLAKAHAAGIIHRDLKPENVMVSKDGFVKILDFGLAKLVLPASGEASAMPTVGKPETQPGIVMGTLAYMSPEQASGQSMDFRTDQFSFGSILYELVTGHRPFEGRTGPETLAAIIREEPKPIGELAPATPAPLRWTIDRCLAKEPEQRYAATGDLARELASVRDHLSEITSGEAALPGLRRIRRWSRENVAWALTTALALALAVVVSLRRPAPLSRLHASVNPPPGTEFNWFSPPALSPDGQRIAFVAADGDGKVSLWLRAFAEKEAQKLPGTEQAIYPFWSPDSQAIGFFTWPEGKAKRVGISGAAPQILCDAPEPRGGAWGDDGTILFGTLNGPLSRVSAAGGQPSPATRLDASRGEDDHRWPRFLPGGRRFLYLVRIKGESRNMTLVAGSLDSPEVKVLGNVDSNVAYAPPGYLLSTTSKRTLVAQPFDVRGPRLFGSPVSVAEQVFVTSQRWTASFSVSAGVLAYAAGAQAEPTRLAWYDRSGKKLETLEAAAGLSSAVLSPDGTRVVTEVTDSRTGTADLWLYDFARGTSTRLTFDPADDQSPIWSPDGRQIAFSSSRKGPQTLYIKPANGATPEEPLIEADREKSPQDWSPDGRFILYVYRQIDGHQDLWALPMTGERKPFPVIQTPFTKFNATFAPDGRSIAYVSNESGRFEVYVQAFPRPGERWQVSTGGGHGPRWRRDGKEMFYVSADGQIMAVEIRTQPEFAASIPRRLFPSPQSDPFKTYDVNRGGDRFLFIVPDRETPKPPITVVFNWLPGS